MLDLSEHRPTRAIYDLKHLAFNFQSVKSFIGKQIEYMAVVKADAYGHGLIECAKTFEKEGVTWLGVALPEEAAALRQADVETRILCLGGFWAGQENLLLRDRITPVVYQLEKAAIFDRAAAERGIIADIHVKIDTGMGRIGVRFDEVGPFAEHLKKYRHLRLEGLMTHFAAADDLGENKFTDLQIKRFNEAAAVFAGQGFNPFYKDLANSPGAIVHPESRGNLVRLGGILYGLGDDVLPAGVEKPDLKPVMSLKTAVAHLKRVPRGETLGYGRTFATPRDSIIATIPIGYEDGVPRLLSNRGKVLINGVFAPMVGRVSMDWTLVDVTDVPKVNVEDEVILIGQQNNFKITAEEWALLTGTISYEITCGINRRVLREYVSSQ